MRIWLALAMLCSPCLSHAADIWVDSRGSDTLCSGTASAPASAAPNCAYATLGHALTQAVCGDTIRLAAGSHGAHARLRVSAKCAEGLPLTISGDGRALTTLYAGLVDVDDGACVVDAQGVWRCPAPTSFSTRAAGNSSYCFVQRNAAAVRFLDANGTKGDMTGPVCVSWQTQGAASLAEGQVFFADGYFHIRPWNNLPPSVADFWAPSDTSFAQGADGPLYIDGDGVVVRDLSVVGGNYCNVAVVGDRVTLDDVSVYTGMLWANAQADYLTLRNVLVTNAYRRPPNNAQATAWGSANSQAMSVQGRYFTIEGLETYAAREGIGFTGASFGTVNGLFAHGHHNHLLKFIDGAHDIRIRDCMTYNGQEPVFIECAYNLEFSHCSFTFSSVVIQENPSKDCVEGNKNLDFFNTVMCGVHYFSLYGNTWPSGGHDLDHNLYISDHGACYQNAWVVGADGLKFENLAAWQAWDGGTCPTCTRDPNSRTARLADTWRVYRHRDDTIGAGYDFGLKPGSAAIDLGKAEKSDSLDMLKNARAGLPDAGAIESGGSQGPPPPPPARCGDGLINQPVEECDGTEMGGATCVSLGFESGTLTCGPTCLRDTSRCVTPTTPQEPEWPDLGVRRTDRNTQ